MIITSVDLQRVQLPISKSYSFGRGSVNHFENIVIRVKGENGQEGIGECVVRAIISSIEEAEKQIRQDIIPAVVGMDSMDIEAIIRKLDPARFSDLGPVAGIELALWDLNGKALDLPAYRLLGGAVNLNVPVSYTLGSAAPEEMVKQALAMQDYGYRTFVVKIGHGTPEEDIDSVRSVRDSLGPDVRIRLDANAAYSVDNAIRVCRMLEGCDIEFIEQPIPPGDIAGLKKIHQSTSIPIGVDEGLQHLTDAIQYVKSEAVGIFNIKPPQCGGLWLSKKIAGIAESAGIPCICGGRLSLEIVRQASRHFVASTPQACLGYAHEGPGPASQPVAGTVTRRTLSYHDVQSGGGTLHPSDLPGLGVELDAELLHRYSV